VWKDKEIEENYTLDFALVPIFNHLIFPFPYGTPLILLGFLSDGNLNLTILPHDLFKVVKCQKRKKRKKEW